MEKKSILNCRIVIAVSVVVWGSSLAPAPLFAQEEHQEEHEAQHEEGHEGEHHHKNEIGLMLGGTYEAEEEETFDTFGLEYVRTLTPTFHMSFVGEHLSDVDAWVFVAPLHVFPWKESGFFVGFGPGFEQKSRRPTHGSEEGGHGALGLAYRSSGGESTSETESEQGESLFLWRTGIGYKIELGGGWAIAPALDWDIVREHGQWVNAIVFDVAIGLGF